MSQLTPNQAPIHLNPIDTVDPEEAILSTSNWRNLLKTFVDNDKVFRAFYIPIADIRQIAEMHDIEGVRGYIALSIPGDLSWVKMLIVPVSKDKGEDILSVPGPNGERVSSIYDFTRPCPSQCDKNSPLFNGVS